MSISCEQPSLPSASSNRPCAFCHIHVRIGSRHALQCVLCTCWQHRVCHKGNKSGVSYHDYINLVEKRKVFTWHCVKCRHANNNNNKTVIQSGDCVTTTATSSNNTLLEDESQGDARTTIDSTVQSEEHVGISNSTHKNVICLESSAVNSISTPGTVLLETLSQQNSVPYILIDTSTNCTVVGDNLDYSADGDKTLIFEQQCSTEQMDIQKQYKTAEFDYPDNDYDTYIYETKSPRTELVHNSNIPIQNDNEKTINLIDKNLQHEVEKAITFGDNDESQGSARSIIDNTVILEDEKGFPDSTQKDVICLETSVVDSIGNPGTVLLESITKQDSVSCIVIDTSNNCTVVGDNLEHSSDSDKTLVFEQCSTNSNHKDFICLESSTVSNIGTSETILLESLSRQASVSSFQIDTNNNCTVGNNLECSADGDKTLIFEQQYLAEQMDSNKQCKTAVFHHSENDNTLVYEPQIIGMELVHSTNMPIKNDSEKSINLIDKNLQHEAEKTIIFGNNEVHKNNVETSLDQEEMSTILFHAESSNISVTSPALSVCSLGEQVSAIDSGPLNNTAELHNLSMGSIGVQQSTPIASSKTYRRHSKYFHRRISAIGINNSLTPSSFSVRSETPNKVSAINNISPSKEISSNKRRLMVSEERLSSKKRKI